jgi:pilus assembly protein CpaB
MRGKSIALLALALGCGLIASVGITQVVARRSGVQAPAVEKQSIYVAAKDIPLGKKLTPELVKLEDWEADKVPAGAVVRAEDVEGRATRARFYAGEPVLEQKLFGRGMGERSDDQVPKDLRVVAVRVDPVTIHHGLILPGSRVDVQFFARGNPGSGSADTVVKTILQDVKVFAVDDNYGLDGTGQETKSLQGTTVSLLVTPAQAEKVTLASETGTIRLIMRSPEDDKQVATTGAQPQDLLGRTESSHRGKESLVPEAARGLDESGKGFQEYLRMVRAKAVKPEAAAVPTREAAHWTMRLLKGPEVNDVELQESDSGSPAAASPSGVWKTSGLSVSSAREVRVHPEAAMNAPERARAGDNGSPGDKEAVEPGKAQSPLEKDKGGTPDHSSANPA